MKRYYKLISAVVFCLNIICNNSSLLAQSSVSIDSLAYFIRNAQDENELAPLDPTDPNYKEPEAELTIMFRINNYQNLKYVDFLFGTSTGKSDVKTFRFAYEEDNGNPYLKIWSRSYPIINNRVMIKQRVPGRLFYKKIYLKVLPVDLNNVEGNSLLKEFN